MKHAKTQALLATNSIIHALQNLNITCLWEQLRYEDGTGGYRTVHEFSGGLSEAYIIKFSPGTFGMLSEIPCNILVTDYFYKLEAVFPIRAITKDLLELSEIEISCVQLDNAFSFNINSGKISVSDTIYYDDESLSKESLSNNIYRLSQLLNYNAPYIVDVIIKNSRSVLADDKRTNKKAVTKRYSNAVKK